MNEEIIIIGGDCLTGHDPETGKELWRWGTWNPKRITSWRLVPSPSVGDNSIIACTPKHAKRSPSDPVYVVKAGLSSTRTTVCRSDNPSRDCTMSSRSTCSVVNRTRAGRDQGTPQIAVSEVHDLRIRIQDLGDGLVLGVVFPGQLQVRRGERELALSFELGAQADHLVEELGFFHRRVSPAKRHPQGGRFASRPTETAPNPMIRGRFHLREKPRNKN